MLHDGRFAPADEVERVVGEAIAAVPDDTPVILDGTPRTMHNVKWMEETMPKLGRDLTHVILIEVDLETSKKRLGLRVREDDLPHAVQQKWDLFNTKVREVIDHYERSGKLIRVDGRGSIEEVHQMIKAAVT